MKFTRHPGYMEVELPEFFEMAHQPEKLALVFSSFQSGDEKLLLDLSRATPPLQEHEQQREHVRHLTNALLHALENMRDSVEMIAFLTSKTHLKDLGPYVARMEDFGYESHLFSSRDQALLWLGL